MVWKEVVDTKRLLDRVAGMVLVTEQMAINLVQEREKEKGRVKEMEKTVWILRSQKKNQTSKHLAF